MSSPRRLRPDARAGRRRPIGGRPWRATPALATCARCFEGVVPAVLATASATGVPNVTYLSKVHLVDDERIALSNQFFSKTVRNLAENPRASLLLVDPTRYDEYRLDARLRAHRAAGPGVRAPAGRRRRDRRLHRHAGGVPAPGRRHLPGASTSSRCRSSRPTSRAAPSRRPTAPARPTPALGELCARLSRCGDLDTLVRVTRRRPRRAARLRALAAAAARRGRPSACFTIASHGYEAEGVGSEVAVGEGVIGMAAGAVPPDAGRQPRPDGEVRPHASALVRGAGRDRPGRRDARCPGWPTPEQPLAVPAHGARPARRRAVRRERARRRVHRRRRARRSRSSLAASPAPIEIDAPERRGPSRRRRPRAPTAPAARRPAAGPRTCASSPSTAARSSTATTSSRAWPAGSCGRCSRHHERRRTHRVHQPRGAPRPDARAARLPRQLREPADPAQAPPRRAGRPDPHRRS